MNKLFALLFLAATMGAAQTVVQPNNGGTGVSSPTGYLYGNGASPATASTTIPAANINWTACPTSATSGTVTVNLTTANCAIITATGGNVTVAVTAPNGPGPYALRLCNDTTARTWTLPGSFLQIGTPFAASFCSTSVFIYDGTNYDGLGSNETPSTMRFSATRSAPANPSASAGGVAWVDSTDLDFEYQNGGAAPFKMFLSGQDCNPVTGTCFGNPPTNGYILSSTTAGVRSWIAPPTGGAPTFPVNPQTATYQVLAADFSSCKNITVASGTFTITLVASGSQPTAGQCIWVTNYGSGTVTVARSGQNINGGTSSLSLTAGTATTPTGALIVSDGTNYFANVFGEVSGSSGVSAFSGDGNFANNSGGTGAVTLSLVNAGAHKYWGNNTGSSAAPAYYSIVPADLPQGSNSALGAVECDTNGATCASGVASEVANTYWSPFPFGNASAAPTSVSNTVQGIGFMVPSPVTFSNIYVQIQTIDASGNYSVAIANSSGTLLCHPTAAQHMPTAHTLLTFACSEGTVTLYPGNVYIFLGTGNATTGLLDAATSTQFIVPFYSASISGFSSSGGVISGTGTGISLAPAVPGAAVPEFLLH